MKPYNESLDLTLNSELMRKLFEEMQPPRLTIPTCHIRESFRVSPVTIKTRPITDEDILSIMAQSNEKRVGVGVSVIVHRKRQLHKNAHVTEFLMGLRKGDHCPGTWGLPGGKMDWGEYPDIAALREVGEEVGEAVQLGPIYPHRTCPYANTLFANGKHFITLYFVAPWLSGEPSIMEPEKCAEWRWVDTNYLPEPLFPALFYSKPLNPDGW